jgi:hypothetical protein
LFDGLGADRSNSRFRVDTEDAVTYISETTDLFNDDSPITNKRIKSISMRFYDYSTKSSITLSMEHGKSHGTLEIEGNDSNWVNGTLNHFREIIESVAPQQKPFSGWTMAGLFIVISIGIGYCIMSILYFLAFKGETRPSIFYDSVVAQPWLHFLAKTPIALFFGFWPVLSIFERIEKLYPSIELQIGPEHTLIEKKKRQKLRQFVLLWLIPLAGAILFEVLKSLFA